MSSVFGHSWGQYSSVRQCGHIESVHVSFELWSTLTSASHILWQQYTAPILAE